MADAMTGGASVNIKAQLAARGLHPQKKFGQNFLLDQNLLAAITAAAEVSANDGILEVGPGTGKLTEKLLAAGAQVVGVEIDRGLARWLDEQFGERENFTLITADILAGKNSLNSAALTKIAAIAAVKKNLKAVANLPYSAGTPFIANLCGDSLNWQSAVFLLQAEVADRLAALPAQKNYGALAVKIALAGKVKILRQVPPAVFYPQPEVQSALVRIDFFPAAIRQKIAWTKLDVFLKILFSARRKTLRRALQTHFPAAQIAAILAQENIAGTERAENIAPEKLYALSQLFATANGDQ